MQAIRPLLERIDHLRAHLLKNVPRHRPYTGFLNLYTKLNFTSVLPSIGWNVHFVDRYENTGLG